MNHRSRHRGNLIVTLLLVSGSAAGAPRVSGQIRPVAIGSEPSCDSCAIWLDLIVEFGDQNDDGIVMSRWMAPYALRDGKWASMDARDPGAFRFYDASGQYTHRIDALGQGPGEYRGVAGIFPTSDGYLIYDRGLGRLSWVSNEFEFLDSRSFPVLALRMEMLPNGDLVYNAVSPSPAARGHLIHVADTAGNPKAVFGGDGRPIDLRMGDHTLHRVIEVAADGTIWTSRLDRYELTAYSPRGDTLRVLTRSADWFQPDAGTSVPVDRLLSQPPKPRIVNIVSDDHGLLWVLIHVPDKRWIDAVRNRRLPTEVPEDNGYLDSVIEVLDPAAGQLLARIRVPEAIRELSMAKEVGAGVLFYRLVERDDGFFSVGILRAGLTR